MDGIRILEVAEHTFVPAASAILADWGAEVIKIEHVTRGDAARGLGSTGIAGFDGKVAVLMEHANRGKKSLGLDLTDPAGRDLLYRLAAISDVFLTNKMAGVRQKLQIEVDDIRAHNPNIVYVRGTGYGNRGPDADAGGYDSLGFWARSGVAHSVTPSDLPQPLNQPGPAFGDSIGAMTIAGGISAALLHRERTGEAQVVDVSLLSTAMWALGGTIAVSQDIGMAWQAPPAGQPAAPFNPLIGYFGTADGRFIMFSMLQGFHYWPEVCERLGRTDLIGDPRFDTHEEGERARFGLYALDQRAAESATVRAWATEQLQGHGQQRHVLVCGDLNDTPQAATTQILLGPPGSQLGTGGFNRPDAGDGNRLWNLAPKMPAGDPATGQEPANWSRINNGVKELIDQILVSHQLVHALDSTESLPIDGIKSATANPASLADMEAPSDHRPVIARFSL